jgi:hypothetical protein
LVHISGNCGNTGRLQNSDIFVTEEEYKNGEAKINNRKYNIKTGRGGEHLAA